MASSSPKSPNSRKSDSHSLEGENTVFGDDHTLVPTFKRPASSISEAPAAQKRPNSEMSDSRDSEGENIKADDIPILVQTIKRPALSVSEDVTAKPIRLHLKAIWDQHIPHAFTYT